MQLSSVDRNPVIQVKTDGVGSVTANGSAATTGVSAKPESEPLRAGVTQPVGKQADYLSVTQGAKGPDTPSTPATTTNNDWTTTEKVAAEKKEKEKEDVKPKLFELLIEQFNSLWRASAQAVDVTTQTQALTQATRQSQQDANGKGAPLVYTDPSKVRKSSAAERS